LRLQKYNFFRDIGKICVILQFETYLIWHELQASEQAHFGVAVRDGVAAQPVV
jgi:hypothetical protein